MDSQDRPVGLPVLKNVVNVHAIHLNPLIGSSRLLASAWPGFAWPGFTFGHWHVEVVQAKPTNLLQWCMKISDERSWDYFLLSRFHALVCSIPFQDQANSVHYSVSRTFCFYHLSLSRYRQECCCLSVYPVSGPMSAKFVNCDKEAVAFWAQLRENERFTDELTPFLYHSVVAEANCFTCKNVTGTTCQFG